MKTFTLEEAQSLLPVLESLLKRAIEGKQEADQIDAGLSEVARRIYLSGGMRVDVGTVAKQRAEMESHLQRVRESIAEIDSIGVQVKDIDTGLLDFPCSMDGQVVLLCWRMGESSIEYWHTMEAGFQGRQPLDERFRRRTNSGGGRIDSVYIPEQEIRDVLSYKALIPAIRQALIDYSAGLVDQPARTILRAGNAEGFKNGWFAVMPVIAGDVMGVKTVTFYPGNADLGLHTHMAVIELLSRATGEPLAVMDGRLITEMRTAAVSAVALDALASQQVTSLGILGSGVQARSHMEAFRLVRPGLSDIRIWSRTAANAERLAAESGVPSDRSSSLGCESGVPSDRSSSLGCESGARAVPIEEAAAADVVLTVTASPGPVLQGRWLASHALVLAIGATGASLRELDDEAMQSSFVVAESRSCAERESGDVRLSGVKVDAEIGEILSGTVPAPAGRRIVFKSVGMAIEDLTAAKLVWQARDSISK